MSTGVIEFIDLWDFHHLMPIQEIRHAQSGNNCLKINGIDVKGVVVKKGAGSEVISGETAYEWLVPRMRQIWGGHERQ